MPRGLQPHEALIVAVSEISRQPDIPGMGVTSEHLAQHPLTKDISQRDIGWAIDRARDAGLLMNDDLLGRTLDDKWHGIRLSNAGLDKVGELTTVGLRVPRWAIRFVIAVAASIVAGLIVLLIVGRL